MEHKGTKRGKKNEWHCNPCMGLGPQDKLGRGQSGECRSITSEKKNKEGAGDTVCGQHEQSRRWTQARFCVIAVPGLNKRKQALHLNVKTSPILYVIIYTCMYVILEHVRICFMFFNH